MKRFLLSLFLLFFLFSPSLFSQPRDWGNSGSVRLRWSDATTEFTDSIGAVISDSITALNDYRLVSFYNTTPVDADLLDGLQWSAANGAAVVIDKQVNLTAAVAIPDASVLIVGNRLNTGIYGGDASISGLTYSGTNADSIIIRGVTFDGFGNQAVSFGASSVVKYVEFDKCFFYDNRIGILLNNGATIDKLVIKNCLFDSTSLAAVRINGTGSSVGSVIIEGNHVVNTRGTAAVGGDAIAFQVGADDTTSSIKSIIIANNSIANITSSDTLPQEIHAIYAFGEDVIITGNTIDSVAIDSSFSGNGVEAIYVKAVRANISNNILRQAGISEGAIVLKGQTRATYKTNGNSGGWNNIVAHNVVVFDTLYRTTAFDSTAQQRTIGINIQTEDVFVHNNYIEGASYVAIYGPHSDAGYTWSNVEIRENTIKWYGGRFGAITFVNNTNDLRIIGNNIISPRFDASTSGDAWAITVGRNTEVFDNILIKDNILHIDALEEVADPTDEIYFIRLLASNTAMNDVRILGNILIDDGANQSDVTALQLFGYTLNNKFTDVLISGNDFREADDVYVESGTQTSGIIARNNLVIDYLGDGDDQLDKAIVWQNDVGERVVIEDSLQINDPVTFPTQSVVSFEKGARIYGAATSDTLYFLGKVDAPPTQIFDSGLTVAFSKGTGNVNQIRSQGLNDVFYAEWWGAAGDSSTNSTTALQEAINASISRGAWIQLLDGYYLVNATLVVNSWCRIRGTNIGKSYIKLMDNSNVHLMRTGLYGAAMDLEGFVLDANGNNQTGGSALVIAQFTGGPVTIRNMIIRNGADYGVYGTSQNLLLTESQIDQNGKGGVWFRNGNVYTVSNNHIQAQDSGAVFQLKFSNATPDTVYWTLDSTVSTINTSATEFISANTIFSNHFESGDVVGDSMRYVVWLDNSDGNTFIGNEFSFNNSLTDVSAAVYVDSGSGQNTFIGNNVQQGNGSSWRIMGQDNIFMGNKTRGATPSTSDTLAAIYINPGQGNLWWDTERYATGKSDETGFYGAGRFNFFGTDSLTVANTEIKRISGNTYIDATTSDLNLRSPSGTLRMESSTGRYYLGSGNFFQVISDTLCWIKSSPAETTRVAPPRP